jgi:hypothetical protein
LQTACNERHDHYVPEEDLQQERMRTIQKCSSRA